MRANEFITNPIEEMALTKFQTFGDFSKPGPFRGPDKKLVPHPKTEMKAHRFFQNTPYDFRLFFAHIKGVGKFSEHGEASYDDLMDAFGEDVTVQILNGHEDAITVVYVGNKGDAKRMLTPWLMAHRFGHAANAGSFMHKSGGVWDRAEKHFFNAINNMLSEFYNKASASNYKKFSMSYDLVPEYNALFNAIGTQKSSRDGQIKRPYEFLYEIFAQYLGTGKITFNPLPETLAYGQRAWGHPKHYLNIKS